jgi:hypothetical protein
LSGYCQVQRRGSGEGADDTTDGTQRHEAPFGRSLRLS